MHPRIICETRQIIAYPPKLPFEKSLSTGQLPSDWKYGTIMAIYKKGAKSEAGNYRPVSLTSVICKTLESIISEHTMEHAFVEK